MSARTRFVSLTAAWLLLAAPAPLAQCGEVEIAMWGGPQKDCGYGEALAVQGDLALIGAPDWQPSAGFPREGLVTLARWNGGSWDTSQLPSPANPNARFGAALAINEAGNVLAVGAPRFGAFAPVQGMVGLYEWDDDVTGFMYGVGLSTGDELGSSVDASGDLVIAGAPAADSSRGYAQVFRRVGPGSWVLEQTFLGANTGEEFGFAVAVSGDRIAIGAPRRHDGVVAFAGAVDVFEHDGVSWVPSPGLVGAAVGQRLGSSVDLEGELMVVGSPGLNGGGGEAVLGRFVGGLFEELLTTTGPPVFWQLGFDVAISDSRCAVGVPNYEQGLLGIIGAVELLHHVPGYPTPWNQAPLTVISGAPEDEAYFGRVLALSGERLLVASTHAEDALGDTVGRVVSLDLADSIGFVDLGQGMAGFGGQLPQLVGHAPPCNQPEIYHVVSGARPTSVAHLVLGFSDLSAPFKGGVLVPVPDLLISPLVTDASGSLALFGPLPTGLPAASIFTQLWVHDLDGPKGYSASNGLRSDLPAF
jgi:hypothetical protein